MTQRILCGFDIPDHKKIRVIIDTDAACEADVSGAEGTFGGGRRYLGGRSVHH